MRLPEDGAGGRWGGEQRLRLPPQCLFRLSVAAAVPVHQMRGIRPGRKWSTGLLRRVVRFSRGKAPGCVFRLQGSRKRLAILLEKHMILKRICGSLQRSVRTFRRRACDSVNQVSPTPMHGVALLKGNRSSLKCLCVFAVAFADATCDLLGGRREL